YDAVVSVQWPFGYGLSYTTFEYNDLKVDHTDFTATDSLTFTVNVKNTGSRQGKEVVMLFSRDLVASIVPDNRRLRAFTKVDLQPGETKNISLTIAGSDLAFVNPEGKWTLEEGDFRMQVGNQVTNIRCIATKVWQTPNR
ncbi:MAG: fibronectin type III-like domain-contianing protein, partial [Bacteroidaceae bacterium]|nr:fibronectin type III-like domain-contianing protein [Bacteroidaceae bacterium]